MIIGLSGLYGSGKGEVVRFLEARSFRSLSLSDVIREELAARGLEETRERMIETGNAIRAAEGPGALAVRLAAKLDPEHNYAIDSIRHPAEVTELRSRVASFRKPVLLAAVRRVRRPRLRCARHRESHRPDDRAAAPDT